jgi:hypothetical protein
MMAKKLYECRYEIVYYAEAESVEDAQDHIQDVARDDFFDSYDVTVNEVKFKDHPIDGGWDKSSLLYGTDGDKKLSEALGALPERPKR